MQSYEKMAWKILSLVIKFFSLLIKTFLQCSKYCHFSSQNFSCMKYAQSLVKLSKSIKEIFAKNKFRNEVLLYLLKFFLRISADLNVKGILKILVCYYHMTISWFPVKVKISSLLSHRKNPRHDTLDLTQSNN